ncbi:MAG: phosphate signaling complex protein PhoU [Anaerolineales bacterium]|nr:phosphate signaling complex protein PhoU [Anaerolineales bacterium]
MPRETLDKKIHILLDEVLMLDSMVEEATRNAILALNSRNLSLARDTIAGDLEINRRRYMLENDCMVTIATQQPIMAGDLRLLASILEVAGEMERMGDYAKGIARVCLLLNGATNIRLPGDIPRMADIAVGMMHKAIGAFVTFNAELAHQIPEEDDLVDALHNKIYRELVEIMFADPTIIDRANQVMWVAHNLERMADRVANICERTIYVVTGKLVELDASDDEMTAISPSVR